MMRFAKAHAYGNDFLYVLRSDMEGVDGPELARQMCHRTTGIGADGLIVYAAHLGVLCGQCFQIRKQGCCLWRGWTGRRLRRLYCLFQSRGQCLEL